MITQVKCVYGSIKGQVRKINQDNLSVNGFHLPKDHSDAEKTVSTLDIDPSLSFCVFDGMGGEQHGEMASFLAASVLSEASVMNREADITDLILQMNDEICKCTQRKKNEIMGTTIAGITFTDNSFFAYNVGDSRVYRFDGGITQLSEDHCVVIRKRKYGLTQYLGIPEDDFLISPHIASGVIRKGQQFCICSDGVTDMLGETELDGLLSAAESLEEKYDRIMRRVKEKGEKDNASLILLEIIG